VSVVGAELDRAWDKLEAIYAYDTGSTDTGIHDEGLRDRLVAILDAASEEDVRLSLTRWVRDAYLSDEALGNGYGWEDAREPIMMDGDLWEERRRGEGG
jgi:hypothetical protein